MNQKKKEKKKKGQTKNKYFLSYTIFATTPFAHFSCAVVGLNENGSVINISLEPKIV